jgi:tRNA G18 (ribose-2'-O)-methylase SpoU
MKKRKNKMLHLYK